MFLVAYGFPDLQTIDDIIAELYSREIRVIKNDALNLHERHIHWKEQYVGYGKRTKKGILIILNAGWEASQACFDEVVASLKADLPVSVCELVHKHSAHLKIPNN